MQTIQSILDFKDKHKISMLTAYDYPTAKVLEKVGIDILLVGDSLGMVVLGFENTKSVTLEDMTRHGAAVVRGAPNTFTVIDMPFATCDTPGEAIRNSKHVLEKTAAAAVKIEGSAEIVKFVVEAGINVMGHTGLKPQTVSKYSVIGKNVNDAEQIFKEAMELEKAGAFAIVLESVPKILAGKITQVLKIPTIGIGASNLCDGQVLVTSDMIGLFNDFKPKFVRKYANVAEVIEGAVFKFKKDIQSGNFPLDAETYL